MPIPLAGEVLMAPQPCPNESGECCVEGCDNEQSPAWYGKVGAKYCRSCYHQETKERGKRSREAFWRDDEG